MATTFAYKETRTRKMSLKGDLDVSNMTITIDDIDKKLSTLLKEFDGLYVEMTIGVKSDEDLEEPEEDAE